MGQSDYARIEKAIHYLEGRFREQPSLRELASHVHLSEYHFQRLFRRWAGISPKRFLQFLTAGHALDLLRESHSLPVAAEQSGLSGTGRLHDLLVNLHAVTPGEWQRQGGGLAIRYGFHDSPFGDYLLAATERGVCALSFVGQGGRRAALDELRRHWPAAILQMDETRTRVVARPLFATRGAKRKTAMDLHVRGTNFQIKVWEALLRIPPGEIASYEDVAGSLGMPRAARSVASAIASNPVAVLIPCHRVIRKSGAFGEYHWGTARKKALIAWESARMDSGGALRRAD